MASEQARPDGGDQPAAGPGYSPRRLLLPAVRWGSVLIGVAAGILAELLLTAFGITSGFGFIDIRWRAAGDVEPWLWVGIAMLVGAFVAGYLAARLSGWRRTSDGLLHGMVAWAVTTVLFSALATAIGGLPDSGRLPNYSGRPEVAATAHPDVAVSLARLLRAQGLTLDEKALRQWQQDLQAGKRDAAIDDLVQEAGIDPARAATLVDQALIAISAPPAAARKDTRSGGAVAWGVLFGVALSLAIAMGGGALGAVGGRHARWRGGDPV